MAYFRFKTLTRVFLFFLTLSFFSPLGAFSSSLSASRDTLFVDPLPSAERLMDLRDTSCFIAPNPYYQSPLSRVIRTLLINQEAPYRSNYLKLPIKKISTLEDINDLSVKKVDTPIGIDQFLLGCMIDNATLTQIVTTQYHLLDSRRSELRASRIGVDIVEATPTHLDSPELNIPNPNKVLPTFTLERRYWKFGLESHIQFSQNYVSKNWHKGGGSNLNLYNRQYINATYTKDNLSWVNELEWRLSAYTSEADTISRFRIADDLLRFHTNFGLKAYKDLLFYTIDAEVKTSLFTRREENKREILSALFSPVNLNVGLGMRYALNWKSDTYYGRKLKLSIILSPLAYDFRWSYKKSGMDLTRHGFAKGKNLYQAFGSTFRLESAFDITSSISWQSRFYYNTSYHRIEMEWDNGLDLAISRFFSTRFMVQLRFDDAVPRTIENPHRIQINELFSFGFRYVL